MGRGARRARAPGPVVAGHGAARPRSRSPTRSARRRSSATRTWRRRATCRRSGRRPRRPDLGSHVPVAGPDARIDGPVLRRRRRPRRSARRSGRRPRPRIATARLLADPRPAAGEGPRSSTWTAPAPTARTGPRTRRATPRSSRARSAVPCASSGCVRTSTAGTRRGRRSSSTSGQRSARAARSIAWETQAWLPPSTQGLPNLPLLAPIDAGLTQPLGRATGQVQQNIDPPYRVGAVHAVVHWLERLPVPHVADPRAGEGRQHLRRRVVR